MIAITHNNCNANRKGLITLHIAISVLQIETVFQFIVLFQQKIKILFFDCTANKYKLFDN